MEKALTSTTLLLFPMALTMKRLLSILGKPIAFVYTILERQLA
uniref:Uncharacterized protein MANES_02G035800 n=1 Tax=Rhizophora mucronata TaxID=61149 RepID=A0A2P2K5Z2_RHIMU